ncbi:MAG: peptidoglycan editing factor PgeF [Chloroflexi bacterium]|nr:peptidoglycan editing factor PgeF [Chloroflexota bacterium]
METRVVLRCEKQGVVFYQFTMLGNNGLFSHGIFSRRGGVSRPPWHSLNVGRTVGDDAAAVQTNHQRIYNTLNLPAAHRATARQVGGAQVACVTEEDAGYIFPATDALVTNVPGVPLVMRFADCLPIVLYDRVQGVAGLVHAGWKGTVRRIVQAAVQTMTRKYGCLPANIRAGIGPGIGPCCYEVGADVIRLVRQELPYPRLLESRAHGHAHLDLWEANRVLLAETGVTQIELAGLCTACHTDEWFSHRREHGRTGRFAVVIALEQR